ncbi:hypothetical protein RJT34_16166 [Clitoria ternatea]|uniref:Uncharacterized protein n=1 Tax=Clitoria ternatea TaxID=43366 RepID=A0AAN9J6X3_CLITE
MPEKPIPSPNQPLAMVANHWPWLRSKAEKNRRVQDKTRIQRVYAHNERTYAGLRKNSKSPTYPHPKVTLKKSMTGSKAEGQRAYADRERSYAQTRIEGII